MGTIYCLVNDSLPGLVKVGYTTRDLQLRVAELSAATGVPTIFSVLHCWDVPDRLIAECERDCHAELQDRWHGKEFFRLSYDEALARIAAVVERWNGGATAALLWHIDRLAAIRDRIIATRSLRRAISDRISQEDKAGRQAHSSPNTSFLARLFGGGQALPTPLSQEIKARITRLSTHCKVLLNAEETLTRSLEDLAVKPPGSIGQTGLLVLERKKREFEQALDHDSHNLLEAISQYFAFGPTKQGASEPRWSGTPIYGVKYPLGLSVADQDKQIDDLIAWCISVELDNVGRYTPLQALQRLHYAKYYRFRGPEFEAIRISPRSSFGAASYSAFYHCVVLAENFESLGMYRRQLLMYRKAWKYLRPDERQPKDEYDACRNILDYFCRHPCNRYTPIFWKLHSNEIAAAEALLGQGILPSNLPGAAVRALEYFKGWFGEEILSANLDPKHFSEHLKRQLSMARATCIKFLDLHKKLPEVPGASVFPHFHLEDQIDLLILKGRLDYACEIPNPGAAYAEALGLVPLINEDLRRNNMPEDYDATELSLEAAEAIASYTHKVSGDKIINYLRRRSIGGSTEEELHNDAIQFRETMRLAKQNKKNVQ